MTSAVELSISADHPDADHPLLPIVASAFARRGACVRVFAGARNCVCRAQEGEHAASATFVVEVEGLANLMHEYVHALFHGRLEDDHGFDYSAIPLDLSLERHRAWTWEELACCVVSCAYAQDDPLPWFVEQFEIQPVFHGLEEDLLAFRERVDRAATQYRDEVHRTVTRAYALVEADLAAAGAESELRLPRRLLSFWELWCSYRAGWGPV